MYIYNIYVYIYIYVFIYSLIYNSLFMYMLTYIYTCIRIYVYTYTYIDAHTHTHEFTQTMLIQALNARREKFAHRRVLLFQSILLLCFLFGCCNIAWRFFRCVKRKREHRSPAAVRRPLLRFGPYDCIYIIYI